jgi:hypothetical protein
MKRILLALALACAGQFVGGHGVSAQDVSQRVGICDPTPFSAHYCAKPDSSGNVPVTGTLSASIGGFPGATPTTGTPISVTTGGVTGTLPAGTVVVATNVGTTNAAYCKLGASATTSDQYIAPSGGWFAFTVGAATQLTCITSTSTTTVNMVGGAGIATGTGGGGSGGGGVVTQPTAANLNATVVGTGTFATQAAQSGTWTVQPGNTANTTAWKVDGSAVTQPTSHASGSVASGAYASGSIASGAFASGAVASGAVASGALAAGAGADGWDVTQGTKSDAPCASGSTTPCSAEARLAHIENLAAAALPAGSAIIGKVGIDQTTDGTTNAVHLVAGTAIAGKVGIDQTTPGTTNAVQAIAGTTGGTTPFTLTAANTTNATNIKASAGLVDHVSVYNISATPAWVSFYDTSGTPTCGTAIKYQVLAPANSTSGAGAVEDYAIGVGHASGIGICFTTGIAGTGAVAASTYVVNVFYK